MFSSIFGKRRSSPVEDETPPIPGPAKADEGFEIVDGSSISTPRGGLYPNVSGTGSVHPYPQRPAPPLPSAVPAYRPVDHPFYYLQGVPFQLSKDLQLASNKDSFTTEIVDMLAFLTSKVNMSGYDYDFTIEKSVLREM